jgi:hypothetical protein
MLVWGSSEMREERIWMVLLLLVSWKLYLLALGAASGESNAAGSRPEAKKTFLVLTSAFSLFLQQQLWQQGFSSS